MPLAFDWHAINGLARPHDEEDTSAADLLEDQEDPYGLNAFVTDWNPMRFEAKHVTVVDPATVRAGDFVIMRAKPIDNDTSSFQLGDLDIPLWLCKARPWHVHHRFSAQPVTSPSHLDM